MVDIGIYFVRGEAVFTDHNYLKLKTSLFLSLFLLLLLLPQIFIDNFNIISKKTVRNYET